eukprot:3708862-Prymnesium_polylepis.2
MAAGPSHSLRLGCDHQGTITITIAPRHITTSAGGGRGGYVAGETVRLSGIGEIVSDRAGSWHGTIAARPISDAALKKAL